MPCPCPSIYDNSGNAVYGIPLKVGQPLSTLPQRFVGVGSIPSVINFGGFTTVDGALVTGVPSNGGIGNPVSFFSTRSGSLYNSPHADLAEVCC